MTKVRFIYIGETKREHKNSSFNALKLSNKDKERLHPLWSEKQRKNTIVLYPQTDLYSGEDKVFVRGLGEKKFGKTNKVEVPIFSGEIEDWDNYLNSYGKECLFYSLTGYSLDDWDACISNSVDEFLSLLQCKGGITQYQKYVENIEEIQRIQTEKINEKFSYLSDWERKYFIKDNLIRPCFRVFMFITTPYLDTPNDDVKLLVFYKKYRRHEIETNHTDYKRMIELKDHLMKEEGEKFMYVLIEKYKEYEKEYSVIRKGINDTISETLDKEINEENGVFPICMADRMKFLFGEKCYALYKYILDKF